MAMAGCTREEAEAVVTEAGDVDLALAATAITRRRWVWGDRAGEATERSRIEEAARWWVDEHRVLAAAHDRIAASPAVPSPGDARWAFLRYLGGQTPAEAAAGAAGTSYEGQRDAEHRIRLDARRYELALRDALIAAVRSEADLGRFEGIAWRWAAESAALDRADLAIRRAHPRLKQLAVMRRSFECFVRGWAAETTVALARAGAGEMRPNTAQVHAGRYRKYIAWAADADGGPPSATIADLIQRYDARAEARRPNDWDSEAR
jgi:hypothetical protein